MNRLKKIVYILVFIFIVSGCTKKPELEKYLASPKNQATLIDLETKEEIQVVRGTKVFETGSQKDVPENKTKIFMVGENEEKTYYLVDTSNLCENLEEVCQETSIKANMLVNLRVEKLGKLSDQIVTKGEEVEIDHVDMEQDFNQETGEVEGYYVKKEEEVYYLPSTFYQEETMNKENIFVSDLFDQYYGAGYSKKSYIDDITYLSLPKEDFENNPLNRNAHAVHVSMDVFFNQEAVILELCQNTAIDTVVIEMKNDDGRFIFESDNIKQYLDEEHQNNAFKVAMSKEDFKQRIQTMKDQGIYVVGRVVTFKDPNFVSQYPEAAITNSDGSLFIHDALPWPSAYNRTCWQYVVEFCKEAASLGVNEIQFDYVRFPDGIGGKDLDLKNQYNESKIQAIQGFLFYAREQIHALNAYIAADVFGWNMICGDDENIGQFIPAVATVVDVICPMSYPDHFNSGSFGMQYPWQHPRELQRAFTAKSLEVLNSVEYPAIYRSWIQGYDVMRYRITGEPGNETRLYRGVDMINQIEGIREGGATGYIVWSVGGYDNWNNRRDGFIQ